MKKFRVTVLLLTGDTMCMTYEFSAEKCEIWNNTYNFMDKANKTVKSFPLLFTIVEELT